MQGGQGAIGVAEDLGLCIFVGDLGSFFYLTNGHDNLDCLWKKRKEEKGEKEGLAFWRRVEGLVGDDEKLWMRPTVEMVGRIWGRMDCDSECGLKAGGWRREEKEEVFVEKVDGRNVERMWLWAETVASSCRVR